LFSLAMEARSREPWSTSDAMGVRWA
jgi:hypothetical protein